MASTYTLISSQVLASSAASVTFSSIPATYTDLVLKMMVRDTQAGVMPGYYKVQLNSDTSALYSNITLSGSTYNTPNSQTYTNSSNTTGKFSYFGSQSSGATASTFASAELYFSNYTSTAKKPYSSIISGENNSAANAWNEIIASLYAGTSAISAITLSPNAGNFTSDSSFYLYGISNA